MGPWCSLITRIAGPENDAGISGAWRRSVRPWATAFWFHGQRARAARRAAYNRAWPTPRAAQPASAAAEASDGVGQRRTAHRSRHATSWTEVPSSGSRAPAIRTWICSSPSVEANHGSNNGWRHSTDQSINVHTFHCEPPHHCSTTHSIKICFNHLKPIYPAAANAV